MKTTLERAYYAGRLRRSMVAASAQDICAREFHKALAQAYRRIVQAVGNKPLTAGLTDLQE